jgi:DNA repair photolyase
MKITHKEHIQPVGLQPSLFQTLAANTAPRKGIARMAEDSPVTAEGHDVEYHRMIAKSILNRAESQRGLGFQWSINPYRGCEFACQYCYARYTHEFLELREPHDFERKIFVKENAAHLLEQELRKLPANQTIAIGTATDPYQPIERREELTRRILEVFARDSGRHRLGIVTKSVLILRDIELLQQVAEKHELTVNVTITTDDIDLARKLEPRAPRPDLRFRAVRRLREAGIRVGVLCSPAMPGINDSQPQLDRMAYLAAAAKASFLSSGALFLKPSSRQVFEKFVEENFPNLLRDLQRRFALGAFQSRDYQATLDGRVRAACERHGLPVRDENDLLATHSPAIPGAESAPLPAMGPVRVPSRPQQAQLAFGGFFPASALLPPVRIAKSA